MEDKNLSLLKKFLICDVISFQIRGDRYYKTSAKTAKDLGDYKPKTVQTAFQELNNDGYVDCIPYNDGTGKVNDLREVKVNGIERWIYSDDYIEKNKIIIKPLEIKEKNHPLRLAWKNRHVKTKKEDLPTSESVIVESDKPKLVKENKPEELLTPFRLKILQEKSAQQKVNYDKLIEYLKNSSLEHIYQALNYDEGVWYYKSYNKDNKDLWENSEGILYQFIGGNTCTLKILDEDGKNKDSFEISLNKLNEYFTNKGVEFKNLNLKDYHALKEFKLKGLTYY